MVAGPDLSGMNTNNSIVTYPEETEICEKLIQLSFVKIVSSKSERGGARLRKNLLILRLLQKARLEQRNRYGLLFIFSYSVKTCFTLGL